MKRRSIRGGVFCAFALATVTAYAGSGAQAAGNIGQRRKESLSHVFLQNGGQWNSNALFVARSSGMDYWVTKTGTVLDYRQDFSIDGKSQRKGAVVRLNFLNGSTAKSSGVAKRSLVNNFITRAHPEGIESGTYGEVWSKDVYPGVDERHYFDQGRPRYDLVVRPGANPSTIKIQVSGTKSVKVSPKGDLVMTTSVGPIRHQNLYAYQMVGGVRKQVPAAFTVAKGDVVSFKLGSYDRTKSVVIDPLVYGSYFGGDGGHDSVNAVVAEPDGALFMTGWTESFTYPAIQGGYQTNNVGGRTAFITRFQGDAYNVDYNSYLGGAGADEGLQIAVDRAGDNVWILGKTSSTDFPVFGGAVQPTKKTANDWFLFRFAKAPNNKLKPVYGSYLSPLTGAFVGNPTGFGVGPNNELLMGGTITGTLANSKGVPTGANDPFVMRMTPSGKAVQWSRYFGNGSATAKGFTVDSAGSIFITGTSTLPSFPYTNNVYFGGRLPRALDSYVAKFSNAGGILFAAVLGGSQDDVGHDVSCDLDGNAYILSTSGSFDFPRTIGTYGQTMRGQLCITKVKADGSAILASTSIRNDMTGTWDPRGIAIDGQGNVAITGRFRGDWSFPVPTVNDPPAPDAHYDGAIQVTDDALKDAHDWTNGSATDAVDTYDGWLNVFDGSLSTLIFGTYIGGEQDEDIRKPIADAVGDLWVFGWTDQSLGYIVFSQVNPPAAPKMVTSEADMPPYDTSVDPPVGFITQNAWKSIPERKWNAGQSYSPQFPVFQGSTLAYGLGDPRVPATVNNSKQRDGYVLRFRFGLPVISSVSVAPTTVPGGLGAVTNGTVNLNTPAPAEGVTVQLTLDSTDYASFVGSANPQQLNLVIAAGARTGTFQVATNPVTTSKNVLVTANFAGNIANTQFTVVPWLQAFAVTPNKVQGGSNTSAKVTLADVAPAGGATVALSSSDTSVVNFAPATVTIPAGQKSAIFPISTQPQLTTKSVVITASLLGKNLTAGLQVTPVTFNLVGISFSPSTIGPLGKSVGTVTIDRTAPDSGYTVTLSTSDSTVASIDEGTTITIGAGQTTGTFNVTGGVIGAQTDATITASVLNQSKSGAITVTPVPFTLALNPTSVVGGNPTVGTIDIVGDTGIVATKALTFKLTSSVVGAAKPDATTVTIPAGSSSASFGVSTFVVGATKTANITARLGTVPQSAPLEVRAIGVASFSLSPQTIRMGAKTLGTVTLDAAAPAGGVAVSVTYDTNYLTLTESNVVIPAGSTTATLHFTAKVFSRAVSTSVTVTAGGKSKSYTVNINP